MLKLSADSTVLEKDLATLVYPQFQDQIPELFDKIIGFQTIEIKEDGKKILGMVVVNINGKYFYIPVFYYNGFLKPFVHMLDLQKKKFIPITEDTIRFLLKPKASMSVEVVPKTENANIISSPNMANFILNPMLNKISSARKVIKSCKNRNRLYNILSKNAFLLKKASYLLVKEPSTIVEEKVVIYNTPSSSLTVEENDAIYKGDIVVKDKREERARVVPFEYPQNFISPSETGVYDVILQDGSLKRMVMFAHLVGDNNNCMLSMDPKTKEYILHYSYVNEDTYDLMLGRVVNANIWDYLKPSTNLESSKCYILVNKNGKATKPLQVYKSYINSAGIKTILTNNETILEKPYGEDCIYYLQGSNEIIITPDIKIIEVKPSGCSAKLFGNLSNLVDFLKNMGLQELEINKEGAEYTIQKNGIVKRGSYNNSLIFLIKECNLGKKKSKELLDFTGKYYLLEKRAISEAIHEVPYWSINSNLLPSYTQYPVPQDEFYTNANVNGNPNNYNASVEQDVNLLLNAAKTGNQNIFDASILGIIGQDNPERLKEIIPVLNEATNLVGNLLYSLWWNLDDFKKDFTNDEIFELEQSLTDIFKKLGDTCLKYTLRRKLYHND